MKKRQDDYEAFVAKFERKKTSDDCYTPPAVYDAVLRWLSNKVDISGREIIRPFWPDTDYQLEKYPPGCVVVDNPPFSLFTPIVRWYIAMNIDFFLFAQHKTILNNPDKYTRIICGADIIYENGAEVRTSFVSNLFGDTLAMSAPDLYESLNAIARDKSLPKYHYPENVLTFSDISKCSAHGVEISIPRGESHFIRALDCQKEHGKHIYGAGFLLSDRQAAAIREAHKQCERNKIAKAAKDESTHVWNLSDRERAICLELGGGA